MDIRRYFNNRLYGITCYERSLGRSNEAVVTEMLKNGIRTIQYREKRRDMKIKREECIVLRELTKQYNALFIVNDDVELAVEVDADGVHLGQDDMPYIEARKVLKGTQIIGISTHDARQAQQVVQQRGLACAKVAGDQDDGVAVHGCSCGFAAIADCA